MSFNRGRDTLSAFASWYTVDLHRDQELVAQYLSGVNCRKPLSRGHTPKVDSPMVHVLSFDRHGRVLLVVVTG